MLTRLCTTFLIVSALALSACGGGSSTLTPQPPGRGSGTTNPGGNPRSSTPPGVGGTSPTPIASSPSGGGSPTPAPSGSPGSGGGSPSPQPSASPALSACVSVGSTCTPTSSITLNVGSLVTVNVNGVPAGASISATLGNGTLATVVNVGGGQFQIVGNVAGATSITFLASGLTLTLPLITSGTLPIPVNLPSGNVVSIGVVGLNATIASIPASGIASVTSSNPLVAVVAGPLLGQYTVLTAGTGQAFIQITATSGTTELVGITVNP